MAGNESVSIEIKAKSPADAAIESLQAKVKGLERELKKVEKTGKQGSDGFKRGMNESTQAAGGLESRMGSLGKTIMGALSIEVVRRFFSTIQQELDRIGQTEAGLRRRVGEISFGQGADPGQLMAFVEAQARRTPRVTPINIAEAANMPLGLLDQARAFDVTRVGLSAGQNLPAESQRELVNIMATMEQSAPTGSDAELLSRAAQALLSIQASAQGGSGEASKAMAIVREFEGFNEDTIVDALAGLTAAGRNTARGGRSAFNAVVQRSMEATSLLDPETGLPKFQGTQAEIFSRILRGEISPEDVNVAGQNIPRVRMLQSEFSGIRSELENIGARGGQFIGEQNQQQRQFLGATLLADEAQQRTAEAERQNFGELAERNRALIEAERESFTRRGAPRLLTEPFLFLQSPFRLMDAGMTTQEQFDRRLQNINITVEVNEGIPQAEVD